MSNPYASKDLISGKRAVFQESVKAQEITCCNLKVEEDVVIDGTLKVDFIEPNIDTVICLDGDLKVTGNLIVGGGLPLIPGNDSLSYRLIEDVVIKNTNLWDIIGKIGTTHWGTEGRPFMYNELSSTIFNDETGVFTVGIGGLFLLILHVQWAEDESNAGIRAIRIQYNFSQTIFRSDTEPTADISQNVEQDFSSVIKLQAGDTVSLQAKTIQTPSIPGDFGTVNDGNLDLHIVGLKFRTHISFVRVGTLS